MRTAAPCPGFGADARVAPQQLPYPPGRYHRLSILWVNSVHDVLSHQTVHDVLSLDKECLCHTRIKPVPGFESALLLHRPQRLLRCLQ